MAKDNFSETAEAYASFRPTYPPELFQFIFKHVKQFRLAWDAGTGNGQTAAVLANHFGAVHATDISEAQLKLARQFRNINYKVEPAESVTLADYSTDLITSSQAAHWFQLDKFYQQAKRVLVPNGCIVLFGYLLPQTTNACVNAIIRTFYKDITSAYWDEERKLVDAAYATIPFPFREIPSPPFSIHVRWSLAQLTGYLGSWSAVQKYIKATKENPLLLIEDELQRAFAIEKEADISFPVFMRLGINH